MLTALLHTGEAKRLIIYWGSKRARLRAPLPKLRVPICSPQTTPFSAVNGNTATLVPGEIAELHAVTGIPVEINLFHPSAQRVKRIADHLHAYGVANVLTGFDFVKLAHIASDRANVDKNGIFQADVVFVPLEDGDRAQALTKLGKTVLTVDLNPLSRTAVASTVTIVDEVTRAFKNLVSFAKVWKSETNQDELDLLKATFDNLENLKASYALMQKRLRSPRTERVTHSPFTTSTSYQDCWGP